MTAQKKYASGMPSNLSLYDRDFHAWANEQAALLRAGRLADADIPNIAGEIESMGRGEKRELISRLTVLLVHVLKWKFQEQFRSAGWQRTIRVQRRQVMKNLDGNPSLKPQLPDCVSDAYQSAVYEAQQQTGLADGHFPEQNPWTAEQFFQDGWLPEQR